MFSSDGRHFSHTASLAPSPVQRFVCSFLPVPACFDSDIQHPKRRPSSLAQHRQDKTEDHQPPRLTMISIYQTTSQTTVPLHGETARQGKHLHAKKNQYQTERYDGFETQYTPVQPAGEWNGINSQHTHQIGLVEAKAAARKETIRGIIYAYVLRALRA